LGGQKNAYRRTVLFRKNPGKRWVARKNLYKGGEEKRAGGGHRAKV